MVKRYLLITLLVFSVLLGVRIVSAEGTYTAIDTSDGNDGSNDAINFSQGRVWTIDNYGKYIWLVQGRGSATHSWNWSNDLGANWSQGSEDYGFLTRGSVAYDENNDKLHVIWGAANGTDGIIYRRYGITRDGSNNITAITREDAANINLQLNTSNTYTPGQPVALWVDDGSTNGILVALWSIDHEIRGSMRKLSLTSADGTAGNWTALDGTDDSFDYDSPAVDADKIYDPGSGGSFAGATIRGGSSAFKDDLYVFVAETAGSTVELLRASWDSVDKDWSGGWQAAVEVGEMDTSSGYSLKQELITKPVLDTTNDRLYIGWARWKDGTNGDTVSLAYVDSSNTPSSTVDVYSALGAHSYAPTLDIAYDATFDKIYVAYVLSTTNGDNGSIEYKTYNGSTLSSATTFYTTPGGSGGENGSADIPILYKNRSSNNRLLFGFRVNGAVPPTAGEPHVVYWGYETLPTATPVPTATPAPTSAPGTSTESSPERTIDGNCRSDFKHCISAGPNMAGEVKWQDTNIFGSKVSYYLPRSSVNIDTFVQIENVDTFSLHRNTIPWSQGINIVSNIFSVQTLSAFNGYAADLIGPMTLVLPFDKYKLAGVSPFSLKFAYLPEGSEKWQLLPQKYFINIDNETLAGIVKGSGKYALGYLASEWRNSAKLVNPLIDSKRPTLGLCSTLLRDYLLVCSI